MKCGDLVKSKYEYYNNEEMIGLVLKVEEKLYNVDSQHFVVNRLTVYWANGETTSQTGNYVEKIAIFGS